MRNEQTTIRQYLKEVYLSLEDKKAEDIVILDISDISVMADYFIITNGNNVNHVHALADHVNEQMLQQNCPLHQTEGYQMGNWILMDYGDFVIHIFDQENRSFYDLERIWRDGKQISVQDL